MSLPSSTSDKGALRRSLIAVRHSLDEKQRALWDAAIGAALERWFEVHPLGSLGVYWPIQKEPDLLATYAKLAARGVSLSLPVVVGKEEPLQFSAWKQGDALAKDAFGVPVPEVEVFVPAPDALLIPCVGFTAARFRLGYGGGFYDRTLAATPRPYAIGVAYACQGTEFDIGPYDIALDMIVTEA